MPSSERFAPPTPIPAPSACATLLDRLCADADELDLERVKAIWEHPADLLTEEEAA
jgi:hypothetical protein